MCACVCVQPPDLFHNVLAILYGAPVLGAASSDREESRNSFPRMHLTPIVRLRPFIGSGLVLGCDGNLIGGDTLVVKGSLEVGQCRGPDSEPTSAASAGLPAVQPRAGNPKSLRFGKKKKTSLQCQRPPSLTTDWSCKTHSVASRYHCP